MNETTMTVTDALAAYMNLPAGGPGTEQMTSIRVDALDALYALRQAVHAELAPLPEGETTAMAAQAEAAARTMAPPVPGVTVNAGYTVRAVIHMHDAVPGLLAAWLVAAEDEHGAWVTWNAYMRDGSHAGQLSYDAGHYFQHPVGAKVNRIDALADLAVRAGTVHVVAERIAATIEGYAYAAKEDRRMAARLRRYFAR
jgi:hypothetical protein